MLVTIAFQTNAPTFACVEFSFNRSNQPSTTADSLLQSHDDTHYTTPGFELLQALFYPVFLLAGMYLAPNLSSGSILFPTLFYSPPYLSQTLSNHSHSHTHSLAHSHCHSVPLILIIIIIPILIPILMLPVYKCLAGKNGWMRRLDTWVSFSTPAAVDVTWLTAPFSEKPFHSSR